MDDMVQIPHPQRGISLLLGSREVNVHEVVDGEVMYGIYDETAHDNPCRCTGTYRMPIDRWIDAAGKSILDGAAPFCRLEPEPWSLGA
jgi:hypothetical protein